MGVERRVGGGGGGHRCSPGLRARGRGRLEWHERANQAPGMCSVGVRTGGQVEGGMKEVGMKN